MILPASARSSPRYDSGSPPARPSRGRSPPSNGATHPLYGATVSIRDDDGIWGDEHITAVVTDVDGDCIADVHDDKSHGVRMAWAEGWPTYNGTVAQQVFGLASLRVPRVGDTSYQDMEDGSVGHDLDTQDAWGPGEDNELAVQRLLRDLHDGGAEGRDWVSRADTEIWALLERNTPITLSHGWSVMRAGQTGQTELLMGGIAADHLIGPTLVAPADGAIVPLQPPRSPGTDGWGARAPAPGIPSISRSTTRPLSPGF